MTSSLAAPAAEQVGCGPLSARYTEALTYAATLHRNQARKGTRIPYLSHLMSVSALVLEDGGSEDEAIAGLLHDAAEDGGREVLPYIEQIFGSAVADIVRACSDDLPEAGAEKRPWPERKAAYIAHLAEADDAVIRVSAADKLHNARATVGDLARTGWPKSKACHHQNLWYYESLAQIVTKRLPGSRTAELLAGAVDDLFRLTPDVDRGSIGGPGAPSCTCATNSA